MVRDRQGRQLKQLAVSELLHQLPIGIQKVEPGQFAPVHPADLAENAVPHLAFVLLDQKEMQLHGIAVYVVVLQLGNLATDVSANPKFLLEFAL